MVFVVVAPTPANLPAVPVIVSHGIFRRFFPSLFSEHGNQRTLDIIIVQLKVSHRAFHRISRPLRALPTALSVLTRFYPHARFVHPSVDAATRYSLDPAIASSLISVSSAQYSTSRSIQDRLSETPARSSRSVVDVSRARRVFAVGVGAQTSPIVALSIVTAHSATPRARDRRLPHASRKQREYRGFARRLDALRVHSRHESSTSHNSVGWADETVRRRRKATQIAASVVEARERATRATGNVALVFVVSSEHGRRGQGEREANAHRRREVIHWT